MSEQSPARGAAPWQGYAWALALVGVAGGAAFVTDALVAPPDVALVFVAAIMVSAAWHGRGPSILAAAASVATFDLLVPPRYTFFVAEPRYVLTFTMMFGVGLVISALTSRLRAQQRELRAREANEFRSTLLSAVSHDLRTPLAVISGAASTLRDEQLDDAQRGELLTTVCEEAERLERLVGNLLDMTRLQAGAVVMQPQWLPLEEVVGSALARLERRLGDRPVQVALAPGLPLLSVDPVLLEQVLVNLLDNAVKYAPADALIEVRASARGDVVIVQVLDRGPGLPPELGTRAFDKFVRGDVRGRDGFGLGLAICREIVEIHGGTIGATPRPGGGACFEIVLPRAANEPSPLGDASAPAVESA